MVYLFYLHGESIEGSRDRTVLSKPSSNLYKPKPIKILYSFTETRNLINSVYIKDNMILRLFSTLIIIKKDVS